MLVEFYIMKANEVRMYPVWNAYIQQGWIYECYFYRGELTK